MSTFSLEDFDQHIANLRSQLQFLTEGINATDHNAPDWLATDLISLRNKSGRLQDDMKRFRDQLQGEGLAVKKAKVKDGNKRLSIESAKPAPAVAQTPNPSKPTGTAVSPSVDQSPTPRGNNVHEEALYVVEHIDVSEEVRRRLNESRLRRLMDTPSTSHKRKRDAFDDMRSESATETDDDGGSRAGYSGSELEGTPTKRIKSIGSFSQVGKRKENGVTNGTGLDTERFPDREDIKRRKV